MQAALNNVMQPFQTDLDLTTTTALQVKIVPIDPPGGPNVTKLLDASAIIQPPTLRQIQMNVVTNDFPVEGLYELQITDTTPGRFVPTEVLEIYVNGNI